MARLNFPNGVERDDHDLSANEQIVLDFLERNLNPRWEIHVHPDLNGLKPTFVAINPSVGIGLFRILDGTFAPEGSYPEGTASQILGWSHACKKETEDLYAPSLSTKRGGFLAVTVATIAPEASDGDLSRFFGRVIDEEGVEKQELLHPISGAQSLAKNSYSVFPPATRHHFHNMVAASADEIREWLGLETADVRIKVPDLDRAQKELAETRTTSGFRRVRGAAGSGKSLVLAMRAANLLREKKRVLVIGYNITLVKYLRELILASLAPEEHLTDKLQILHFHAWVNRGYGLSGADIPLPEGMEAVDHRVSVLSRIFEPQHHDTFDAILVDEGQDMRPAWWNLLRMHLRPKGEMLLVADFKQDLYDVSDSWTDSAMSGAGFRGQWMELESSYRMPDNINKIARDFGERYLANRQGLLPTSPEQRLNQEVCPVRWRNVEPINFFSAIVDEIIRMRDEERLQTPERREIVVMVITRRMGINLEKVLKERSLSVRSTFDETEYSNASAKKLLFRLNSADIHLTTFHSFKGWESCRVLLVIQGGTKHDEAALTYVGLTRVKFDMDGGELTVLCANQEIGKFGETITKYPQSTLI